MPVAFRFDGLCVVIYPNDHRPANVHVKSATSEAVFILDCPDGPPRLRESFGFRRSDLQRIVDALHGKLDALCADWRAIHGFD